MNKIPFTTEGLAKLKRKQEELNEKRKETVKSLQRAREMGDLSENGLYKAAKMELSDIDRNLRKNKYFLTHAFEIKNQNSEQISLGSKIILDEEGERKDFEIVGDFEAEPNLGKISKNSPIGNRLLNKKINDVVEIDLPSGNKKIYKIIKIF